MRSQGRGEPRWPRGRRWRQWLERGHRPDWPNPRGSGLVGVCPGHPTSYVADLTARRAAIASHPLGDFEDKPAEDGDTDAPEKHDRDQPFGGGPHRRGRFEPTGVTPPFAAKCNYTPAIAATRHHYAAGPSVGTRFLDNIVFDDTLLLIEPVDSDAKCNPVDSIGSSAKSRVSHSEPPPSARFPGDKDGSARRNIEPLQ